MAARFSHVKINNVNTEKEYVIRKNYIYCSYSEINGKFVQQLYTMVPDLTLSKIICTKANVSDNDCNPKTLPLKYVTLKNLTVLLSSHYIEKDLIPTSAKISSGLRLDMEDEMPGFGRLSCDYGQKFDESRKDVITKYEQVSKQFPDLHERKKLLGYRHIYAQGEQDDLDYNPMESSESAKFVVQDLVITSMLVYIYDEIPKGLYGSSCFQNMQNNWTYFPCIGIAKSLRIEELPKPTSISSVYHLGLKQLQPESPKPEEEKNEDPAAGNCSICTESYSVDRKRALVLDCLHQTCVDCMKHIFIEENKRLCPFCRGPISLFVTTEKNPKSKQEKKEIITEELVKRPESCYYDYFTTNEFIEAYVSGDFYAAMAIRDLSRRGVIQHDDAEEFLLDWPPSFAAFDTIMIGFLLLCIWSGLADIILLYLLCYYSLLQSETITDCPTIVEGGFSFLLKTFVIVGKTLLRRIQIFFLDREDGFCFLLMLTNPATFAIAITLFGARELYLRVLKLHLIIPEDDRDEDEEEEHFWNSLEFQ